MLSSKKVKNRIEHLENPENRILDKNDKDYQIQSRIDELRNFAMPLIEEQEALLKEMFHGLLLGKNGTEKSLNIYYLSDFIQQDKIDELKEILQKIDNIIQKTKGKI